MRRVLAALLLASVGGTLAAQQPSAPVFRNGVDAILVDVRAVGRDGRFVSDLSKDDFRVVVNGKDQPIATFDLVNIPIHPDARPMFAGSPVDADVTSNARTDGRLYVIVLDDYHTHPLRTTTVRQLGHEFIEHHFTESDRAVVVTTSGRKALVQEFTNNRKRLLDAIDQFQGGYLSGAMCPDPQSTGHCSVEEARWALQSLSAIAKWLSAVSGERKAIVFISEGFDGGFSGTFAGAGSIEDASIDAVAADTASKAASSRDTGGVSADLAELIQEANRANVSIYAVDPVGLPGGNASGIKPVPMLGDDQPYSDQEVQGRQMLEAIGDNTGGFALTRSNDFSGAFARLVEEASDYYLLGVVPPEGSGANPRIEVRVTRPGVRVQARTNYAPARAAAAKAAASANGSPSGSTALSALMKSPIAVSGLTMTVAALPFPGVAGKTSVEVIADITGQGLQFLEEQQTAKNTLDLLMVVSDVEGKVKASERGSLAMTLSPATRQNILDNGLRLFSRLSVPPGRYVLRVAGVDSVGQTRGAVQYDLEVPDFTKGGVVAGALAVSVPSKPLAPVTGSDHQWKDRFPDPPTTTRTFTRSDELRVSATAYANDSKITKVAVTASVADEGGRLAFTTDGTLSGEGSKPAAFPYRTTIPLNNLTPGNYLLTVAFTNPTNPKLPSIRRIPFAVK
jgi:VWFA-related protein